MQRFASAVLCLDLDRFKTVNDTLGHPIGDALLQAVAGRLRDCVRITDTVARLGGDEFAILLGSPVTRPDIADLAARLVKEIRHPYEINRHEVVIGVTIGIAVAPIDGTDPPQLIKSADIALYCAKADGRGCYRFYECRCAWHATSASSFLHPDPALGGSRRSAQIPTPAIRHWAGTVENIGTLDLGSASEANGDMRADAFRSGGADRSARFPRAADLRALDRAAQVCRTRTPVHIPHPTPAASAR